MVASRPSQPLLSSDETQDVIRSRIREKRLFEARFLCRKLGQGLTAEQRASLEEQLGAALKQVDQLRNQGKERVACGEYGQARAFYAQLEAIAIDVPGVAEEVKALAGAEALAARLAKPVKETVAISSPVLEQEEVAPAIADVTLPTQEDVSCVGEPVGWRVGRFWCWAGIAGVVVCALVVFGLYVGVDTDQQAAPVTPQAKVNDTWSQAVPTEALVPQSPLQPSTLPLAAGPVAVASPEQVSEEVKDLPHTQVAAPSPKKAPAPVEKPASAPPSKMKLGGLQIE